VQVLCPGTTAPKGFCLLIPRRRTRLLMLRRILHLLIRGILVLAFINRRLGWLGRWKYAGDVAAGHVFPVLQYHQLAVEGRPGFGNAPWKQGFCKTDPLRPALSAAVCRLFVSSGPGCTAGEGSHVLAIPCGVWNRATVN